MNLIEIGKDFDPTEITKIDLETSIIACVTETNTNITSENKSIFLNNPLDMSFNKHKILINNFTIFNYAPNVRWSMPNNVLLRYYESSKHEMEYFSTIYKEIVYQKILIENTLISHSFGIYIDRERSRKKGRIKKLESLLEVKFEYKPLATNAIENFYIIRNNYCFQEFEKHFNK